MNNEFKLCKELTKRDADYLAVQMLNNLETHKSGDIELWKIELASMQGYLVGAGLLDITTEISISNPEFYCFIIEKIREFGGNVLN